MGASIGLVRVAGAGVFDPAGASFVIDQVPDPATGGDLVLPLGQPCSAVYVSRQAALEWVLSFGGRGGAGVGFDRIERHAGVRGGLPT